MQLRPTRCGGYRAFSLLVCAAIAISLVSSLGRARAGSLEAGFQHPPDSARPQTWWHWMNGNVSREGITADLEAMKRVGIGGAQIFNVHCGIPAGPVKFMSPEWRELRRKKRRAWAWSYACIIVPAALAAAVPGTRRNMRCRTLPAPSGAS